MLVEVAYPVALAVTVAVPVSLSDWMKNALEEDCPAGIVTVIVASPLPGGVDVRVRGPFTALRGLQPEKLEAVIDLLNATPGEKIYRLAPEDINVPPEVEVIAISPGEVQVALDNVAEKLLPIVPALSGEVASGSQVVDVSVEPRIARVIGPATALGKMTGIGTEPISLANRAATFSATTTVLPEAPGVRVREGQIVNVTVPRRLTEEQRRLLEEFERLAGEDTYEPDEGFFDKLKSAFR